MLLRASPSRNPARTPTISGGSNVSNQSRPTSSANGHPLNRARNGFANRIVPARSRSTAINSNPSRTSRNRRSEADNPPPTTSSSSATKHSLPDHDREYPGPSTPSPSSSTQSAAPAADLADRFDARLPM